MEPVVLRKDSALCEGDLEGRGAAAVSLGANTEAGNLRARSQRGDSDAREERALECRRHGVAFGREEKVSEPTAARWDGWAEDGSWQGSYPNETFAAGASFEGRGGSAGSLRVPACHPAGSEEQVLGPVKSQLRTARMARP